MSLGRLCQLLISSIKGEVKKKHVCYDRSFSCFPARVNEQEFRPAAPWARCTGHCGPAMGVSSTSGFHRLWQRSRSVLRPAKQNGGQVPTMVLWETRGLWLFRVVREGLGSAGRLGARGTPRLTYQLRLALEPECLQNPTATAREDPRDGADSVRDTQAACDFRYWASKRTPFFQMCKVIAAILRANVRRAISGRMPLANRAA